MSSPPRRPSFLLAHEDTTPLVPKGHGALAHLIRNRSHSSLYGATTPSIRSPRKTSDEEEGTVVDWSHIRPQRDDNDDATVEGRMLSHEERHMSFDERRATALLNNPQIRSMRLIGNSNPRYKWERYWKTDEQLKPMKKGLRQYYERTNYLVQQYLYIDRLLDSSLPHDLLNEYSSMPHSAIRGVDVPDTITEEPSTPSTASNGQSNTNSSGSAGAKKVKRTPKDIYRATDTTPLLAEVHAVVEEEDDGPKPEIPWHEDDDVESGAPVVTLAIWINTIANFFLLLGKIAVIITVPSVSVLASLVDAALDFLSTIIVWTTTWLIGRQDQYKYPVGRRRLEPLGVLVFSIIMVTSFVQVALEAISKLASDDHEVIELTIPAIAIMFSTIVIKGLCWLWCRLVRNSSVQALAADAMTDMIFNAGSIVFPIVGFYAGIWWLDALGGLLLSMVVIFTWSHSAGEHIKNLTGFSATADERNILLYLTMRFAKTIRQIQGLQAYHAGDKLNVEVDIVLDASTSLKDSHDLSESLQYMIESVPQVDRAFVHVDYASYNLPTHMEQQHSS